MGAPSPDHCLLVSLTMANFYFSVVAASGSGSELILFDLLLLKPEEASSIKSNRGLLVLAALLPLPNFEWKTEEVT